MTRLIWYVLLFLLSCIPGYFLLKYIYDKDTVEKESKSILTRCFCYGIASVFLAVMLEYFIDIPIESLFCKSKLYYVIHCFIGIALMEEGSKYLVLRLITWKNKEFNYIFDAVVYAAFISLGFATFENVLYVISGGGSVAILRAVSSVPAHFFFSIYMGLFYGISKRECVKERNNTKYIVLTILIPTLVHGVYDYLLYMATYSLLYLFSWIAILIILYVVTFVKIKNLSLSDSPLFSIYNNKDLINKESPNIVKYNNHNTYCTKCGRPMVGVFCSHCGYKIE